MKLVIELDKVAYDLLTGKIETANIDLFSTLIEAVQNGTPLEEELEKIKGKIIACTQQEEGEVPDCINYGLNLSIEIVDNHISELKGE